MPAIETSIWLALKSRVQSLTGWTAAQIAWPMQPYTPPVTGNRPGAYIEVANLPNATVRPYVGSDEAQTYQGILQVTLCWPVATIGTGSGQTHSDAVLQKAGEVAAHFSTDLKLREEGVTVRITRAPDVASPFRDDAYMRVPISISWQSLARQPADEDS